MAGVRCINLCNFFFFLVIKSPETVDVETEINVYFQFVVNTWCCSVRCSIYSSTVEVFTVFLSSLWL